MLAEHTDNSQEYFLNELPQYTDTGLEQLLSGYKGVKKQKFRSLMQYSKYRCANITEI